LGGDSKRWMVSPSLALMNTTAHKDDSVREVLESAMGARDNPLVYIITAGFNLKSASLLKIVTKIFFWKSTKTIIL
jgi:hypothetical protein